MQFNLNNFYNLNINKSIENKNLLIWFIGFSEANGFLKVDEKSIRNYFIINQKDPKVLYKVKKILCCGIVRQYNDEYRFSISDQKGTLKLIQLLNGNIVLNNTKIKLEKYIEVYNRNNFNIIFNKTIILPTKDDGWLSGYIDGKGRFSLDKNNDTIISIKFNEDKDISEHFNKVFLSKLKSDIICFNNESLKKIIIYLNKYPLQTNKNINLIRCKKILNRQLDNIDRINKPKAIKRLNRLYSSLKKEII